MLKQKENYNFMKRKTTNYDKEEIYKKEIAPKISDLKVACTFAGLPMFVTVAIKNDETGTVYQSSIVQSSTGYRMANPCIDAILMHMNGLPADYPDYIKEDIRELQDYLNEIEQTIDEGTGTTVNVVLKEDRIPEMIEIVAGKKKTVVPDELLKQKKDVHLEEANEMIAPVTD